MSCSQKPLDGYWIVNFMSPNGLSYRPCLEDAKALAEQLTRQSGQTHFVLKFVGECSIVPCEPLIQWKTI